YALVGMGAAFAGIVRAPMTSVMLVFEVTRDYAIIVPLMIANLISYFVSQRVHRETLYESLSTQDGIHLPSPKTEAGFNARQISRVMRQPEEVLTADATIQAASETAAHSRLRSWPVMNESGVIGVVSAKRLIRLAQETKADAKLGDL